MRLARALEPGDEGFAPLSRAIRLTLALEARNDQELRDLKAGVVRDREAERVQAAEQAWKAQEGRKSHVVGLVRSLAMAECETREDLLNLQAALHERLEDDEAYWDIDRRPVRQTLERLCKDLTLTPDWSRWDGEGWIDDGGAPRGRFSVFNTPSARPRQYDETGGRLQTPAPPYNLHPQSPSSRTQECDSAPKMRDPGAARIVPAAPGSRLSAAAPLRPG
ncbi:MAG: hypothetical protein ACREEB_00710 [Caulobacteraceae bacterium]